MTLKKFYRQSIQERRKHIDEYLDSNSTFPTLSEDRANQMIENYLYNFQLPMAVVPNLQVNGKNYVVPMVTEEPSVVAAASNGAKHLGNILAHMTTKTLKGQIILTHLTESQARLGLFHHQDSWLDLARSLSSRMVARGGGPLSIDYEVFQGKDQSYHSYYLLFDPCEAMGANALNSVLESLADQIIKDTGGQKLMAILSNYSPQSLVTAEATVPFDKLATQPKVASQIAKKIAMASEFAQLDPYRAATHNKGIMNGVDAVLLATGNDWRAVEAGVHAYASHNNHYRGLSHWTVEQEKEQLKGYLKMPMQVATVGGTLSIHPMAQWSLELLGRPSAMKLATIIASIGLAQNFAALKALVSDGIQKGHMSLHARSLAIQVGAKDEEIERIVHQLKQIPHYNSQIASDLLDKIRNS